MIKHFMEDARLITQRDPAARSVAEVVLLYSGFHAVCLHRVAHWIYNRKRYFIARLISQLGRFFNRIEIHPGAKTEKACLLTTYGCGNR